MKRITTILTLLMLACMGAGAQVVIADGGVYQICIGDNSKVGKDDNGAAYAKKDGKSTKTFGLSAFYKLTAVGDYYYIQENSSNKYLGCSKTQVDNDLSKGSYSRNANTIVLQDLPATDEEKQYFQWTITLAKNSTNVYLVKPRNYSTLSLAVYAINDGYFSLYNVDTYSFAKVSFLQKKVKELTNFSNSKCYNIYNNRAAWAVGSGADVINSTSSDTNGLDLAIDGTDTKQRFAFIKYFGKYFLYSVGEGKFAYKNGTKLSLATTFDKNVLASPVTLQSSTSTDYAPSAPSVITVGGTQFGVSTGYNPHVFGHNDLTDNGNASAIYETASFDATSALTQIESPSIPFTASTKESPIYYALMISTNANSWLQKDGANVACGNNRPLPTGDASDWAWLLIGDATNGYKLYNVGADKYLGGRTSTGGNLTLVEEASAQSFYAAYNDASSCMFYDITNDLWIDRSSSKTYAHTSGQQFTFQRLYKVKFALSEAAAGLQVGSANVSDFNTEYVITTSALLSCTESGYSISAYDGYTTLEEALTNDDDGTINLTIQKSITYKMMFNGSEITSARTVVTEDVGATASTPSAWTAPAYCSFTCPATEITAETSEIEVTLNWAGPFDISTDYASAKWYYIKTNDQWMKNSPSWVAPNLYADMENVKGLDDGLWTFTGNPYDGLVVMLKAKYDTTWEMYLSSRVEGNPAMYYIIEAAEQWTIGRINDNTFTLKKDNKYLSENTTYHRLDYGTNETAATFAVRSYYCQKLIDDLYDWADDNHRNELFGPSESWLTSKESQIISMFPNMSKSTYDGVTIPDDFLPIVPNYPTTGYYRIKNNGTGNYLAYGYASRSDSYTDRNGYGLIATASSTDAASVIKLTGSAGTYKISTQGLNVQSSSNYNKAFPASNEAGADWVFNVSSPGIVSITNAASKVDDDGHDGSLHEGTGGWNDDHHGVINWSASAGNSKWVVEEATTMSVNLNNGGDGNKYATLYLPFGVTIDSESDVEAYIMTINGDYARATSIEKSIPANTGVVLKGTASSVTLTIDDEATATTTGNDLTGTCVNATARVDDNGVYDLVLGMSDGQLGFYKAPSATLAANKAYLPYTVSEGARGYAIQWDESETTGINEVTGKMSDVRDGAYYDLQGRKVAKPSRGMYIVNGKKVVIK